MATQRDFDLWGVPQHARPRRRDEQYRSAAARDRLGDDTRDFTLKLHSLGTFCLAVSEVLQREVVI